MVSIAYGTSAFVNSMTGSAYSPTDVTAAIALADDFCESYTHTTWVTAPTHVVVASSIIAKNILESGMLNNIQKSNMEPIQLMRQFITREVTALLQPEIDQSTYSHASEDFQ